MSHYRNLGGGKRDANEPQIMKRFRSHGWRVEQISGNRLWDLLVIPPKDSRAFSFGCQTTGLVDVKQADGEVTPAQAKKWKELHADGIPIYVVRTSEDVDAMVRGALQPWEPEGLSKAQMLHGLRMLEKTRANYTPPRSTPVDHTEAIGINRRFDAERTRRQRISAEKLAQQIKSGEAAMSNGYEPPRTLPVDVRTRLGTPVRKAAPHYFPPASPPLDAANEAEATFAPCGCGECAKCKAWSSVFSPR